MAAFQRKLVHKQFNSPIGLYSQQNVKETLDRELKAFGGDGIEIDEQITKPLNLANSAVMRAVAEEEEVKCATSHIEATCQRQSRPRQRQTQSGLWHATQQSSPHPPLHQQQLEQIKTQYLSHQHNVTIDRDTVLKINRLTTRRNLHKRDHSWPPPKKVSTSNDNANQVDGNGNVDDDYADDDDDDDDHDVVDGANTHTHCSSANVHMRSLSHDNAIHFGENVCKRHCIDTLREKFNSPTRIIELTPTEARRHRKMTKTKLQSPKHAANKSMINVNRHTKNETNFGISNDSNTSGLICDAMPKQQKCLHQIDDDYNVAAAASMDAFNENDGSSLIDLTATATAKGFSAPETKAADEIIGLVEPRRKYYENLARLEGAKKKWCSYENITTQTATDDKRSTALPAINKQRQSNSLDRGRSKLHRQLPPLKPRAGSGDTVSVGSPLTKSPKLQRRYVTMATEIKISYDADAAALKNPTQCEQSSEAAAKIIANPRKIEYMRAERPSGTAIITDLEQIPLPPTPMCQQKLASKQLRIDDQHQPKGTHIIPVTFEDKNYSHRIGDGKFYDHNLHKIANIDENKLPAQPNALSAQQIYDEACIYLRSIDSQDNTIAYIPAAITIVPSPTEEIMQRWTESPTLRAGIDKKQDRVRKVATPPPPLLASSSSSPSNNSRQQYEQMATLCQNNENLMDSAEGTLAAHKLSSEMLHNNPSNDDNILSLNEATTFVTHLPSINSSGIRLKRQAGGGRNGGSSISRGKSETRISQMSKITTPLDDVDIKEPSAVSTNISRRCFGGNKIAASNDDERKIRRQGIYYNDGEKYILAQSMEAASSKPTKSTTKSDTTNSDEIEIENLTNTRQQRGANEIVALGAKYGQIQESIAEHLRQIDTYIVNARSALNITTTPEPHHAKANDATLLAPLATARQSPTPLQMLLHQFNSKILAPPTNTVCDNTKQYQASPAVLSYIENVPIIEKALLDLSNLEANNAKLKQINKSMKTALKTNEHIVDAATAIETKNKVTTSGLEPTPTSHQSSAQVIDVANAKSNQVLLNQHSAQSEIQNPEQKNDVEILPPQKNIISVLAKAGERQCTEQTVRCNRNHGQHVVDAGYYNTAAVAELVTIVDTQSTDEKHKYHHGQLRHNSKHEGTNKTNNIDRTDVTCEDTSAKLAPLTGLENNTNNFDDTYQTTYEIPNPYVSRQLSWEDTLDAEQTIQQQNQSLRGIGKRPNCHVEKSTDREKQKQLKSTKSIELEEPQRQRNRKVKRATTPNPPFRKYPAALRQPDMPPPRASSPFGLNAVEIITQRTHSSSPSSSSSSSSATASPPASLPQSTKTPTEEELLSAQSRAAPHAVHAYVPQVEGHNIGLLVHTSITPSEMTSTERAHSISPHTFVTHSHTHSSNNDFVHRNDYDNDDYDCDHDDNDQMHKFNSIASNVAMVMDTANATCSSSSSACSVRARNRKSSKGVEKVRRLSQTPTASPPPPPPPPPPVPIEYMTQHYVTDPISSHQQASIYDGHSDQTAPAHQEASMVAPTIVHHPSHQQQPQHLQQYSAEHQKCSTSRESNVINRSFDNVSPRPYITIEGYKRVAWPPASEERFVREFTPQPHPFTAPDPYALPQPRVGGPVLGPIYNNVEPAAGSGQKNVQKQPQSQQYQQPKPHQPQQQQQNHPQQQYQNQQQQQHQPQQQQQYQPQQQQYQPQQQQHQPQQHQSLPQQYHQQPEQQKPIQYTQAQYNRQPSHESVQSVNRPNQGQQLPSQQYQQPQPGQYPQALCNGVPQQTQYKQPHQQQQQQQYQPPQQQYQPPQQQYQPPQQQYQPPQQQYQPPQQQYQPPQQQYQPPQQPPQQQQQQYQQHSQQQQYSNTSHQSSVPSGPSNQSSSGSGWKPIQPPVSKDHNQYTCSETKYNQPPQQQQEPYDNYQSHQPQQQHPYQQPQYQAPSHYNQQQQQQPPQYHQSQAHNQYDSYQASHPKVSSQANQQYQPNWAQPAQQYQPHHQQQQHQQQPQYQSRQQYQAPSNYQTPSPQQQQQQPHQPSYQSVPQTNQYNSYSQPHQHQQQQHLQQSQRSISQDQTDYQRTQQSSVPPQDYRGASPGIIKLRKETPVTQKPSPVYTSQPAAINFEGGSHLRGDLKWPPPEYKEAAARENEERRKLALGPVCRPRKVHRDYTGFFSKNALNLHYPSYKVPPGTQHMIN